MARKDENLNITYFIPKNFEEKSVTSNGLSYRNLIEAVVIVGVVVSILWFVPIENIKVKIIIGIIVGGPLAVFTVFGINKCSVSEYLINFLKFKLMPKMYVRKNLFKNPNISKKLDKSKAKN